MKQFKGLQKTLMASTVIILISGIGGAPTPAGASTLDTNFGSCIGSAGGSDCVTTNGHISASVVGTLSINEMRAISFGNFAVTCAVNNACVGGQTIILDPTGVRLANTGAGADSFTLLHGAGATPGPGANIADGSQSPGHYTVSADKEGATSQVYISFADSFGNVIDACSPNGSTGGVYGGGYTGTHGTCDVYHPNNKVILSGPAGNTFTVDQFTFNESGSDVYGHYISNNAVTGVEPVSGTPFLPGTAGNGHNGTPATGAPTNVSGPTTAIDVVVGATLHTVLGVNYVPGKYTNTYNVMVSY
jgi:hypothetical protein